METTDGRYVKILEIEPINFMLRSSEEQYNILSSFASWLKISPMKLQFKSITRKADSDKHIAMIRKELSIEDNAQCKAMGEDYIRLIKDVGSREALTRRFFLIYQYEAIGRSESDDYSKIYSMLVSAEQNARAYFMQCGNNIIQPQNPDQAVAEILYMFFNRRSCVDEPFTDRVNRVIIDTMAAKGKIIGIDPIPHISVRHFIAPRGLDLSHYNYIVMDGRYYCFLYIKGNGYPSTVRGGWMSSLINAGEGIDIDVHLSRENRSKTIDKVAQRIRLNRTKLKGMQDTSTDYEELTNSIQAGYYIKNGITHDNNSLYADATCFPPKLKKMPILGDLHKHLLENPMTTRIAAIVSRFVTGSAQSFNRQTNVDLTNKYIVLDLSELKGKLLPVGMMIALDYVWDNIKADRVKKKAIMIDEIWQLIGASSNKLAAEFCLEIFKVIRGYGGAAIAATQDLSDFFSLDDGKYGRAIINNSKNKIILNLEQDEAQYVKDVLKLTRTEVRSITQFERGEALIHSNNNKVPVVIKASVEEKEMITTDRAELEAILRKRQKEAT